MKVEGHCIGAFSAVRRAFEENFKSLGEVGASLAIVQDGELVVDLWGGHRDAEKSADWKRDSLANIWSTTKGVTAICFAMIAERGLMRYDQPVSEFWPEFAAEGKADITIAMLLSHQAGLCGFATPATVEDFYNASDAAERLAAQAPFWAPGTQSGYHAISIGLLATHLFQKIEGRSLRAFVADELSGYDISIGLPNDRADRAATMIAAPAAGSSDFMSDLSVAQLAALANPPLDQALPNQQAWRDAEIPSANGFANAQGLARLYGDFLADGKLVSTATRQAATGVLIDNVDAVLGVRTRWASGFLRNVEGVYGPGDAAFGHSGWGGAFAFADPDRGLAMAYVMNRMGTDLVGDPRNVALIKACFEVG